VARLDSAAAHGVQGIEARNDLPGRKGLYLKLVVGRFGDEFCDRLDRAVKCVEGFLEARR
jgi:hypothetical protein